MARTPMDAPLTPEHQQMNRSNDPEITKALDAAAPELAMASRQGLTGSAVGVGSVAFDDPGVFSVGSDGEEPQEQAVAKAPPGDAEGA